MKKFSLSKKSADVYAFAGLLLATSLILVYTDQYNKPTADLVAGVYLQAEFVDELALDDDAVYAYKQETGDENYAYFYQKYRVIDVDDRSQDIAINGTGEFAPAIYKSNTALFYRGSQVVDEVDVEIKDRKIRIEKEDSPYHYCKIQGWVGDAGMPIICAPNYFMVVIEEVSA